MLKKLLVIGLMTAIALAPVVFAPAAASAKSKASVLACSGEAGAKGLHGKPRKKFMSQCEKASAGPQLAH